MKKGFLLSLLLVFAMAYSGTIYKELGVGGHYADYGSLRKTLKDNGFNGMRNFSMSMNLDVYALFWDRLLFGGNLLAHSMKDKHKDTKVQKTAALEGFVNLGVAAVSMKNFRLIPLVGFGRSWYSLKLNQGGTTDFSTFINSSGATLEAKHNSLIAKVGLKISLSKDFINKKGKPGKIGGTLEGGVKYAFKHQWRAHELYDLNQGPKMPGWSYYLGVSMQMGKIVDKSKFKKEPKEEEAGE